MSSARDTSVPPMSSIVAIRARDDFRDDLLSNVAAHLGCTPQELGIDWVAFVESVTNVVCDPDPRHRSENVGKLAISGNAVSLL